MNGTATPLDGEITDFDGTEAAALSPQALNSMATAYLAGRGTSTLHLSELLLRKARRWHERRGIKPDENRLGQMVADCVATLVTAGYVDDVAFAAARSRRLVDKGLPGWRVRRELAKHGVADVAPPLEPDAERQAHRYAARKRLGPYRSGERAAFRDKDVRSLIRAGFSFALAAATIDHPAAIHDDVGEAEKADQAHDS